MGRISQDVNEFIRIGGFAYLGKEELGNNAKFNNNIFMYGPDATLSYLDKLELNVQYLTRIDDSPNGPVLGDDEVSTDGFMTELIYTPDGDESKWYAVGLYNWVDSDLNPLDYKSLTGHAGYLLRRNVRVFGEYTYNFTDELGQFTIGVVSAF